MTLMIKAKCPNCFKEFERRLAQLYGQKNPPRWIACSKSCNFALLMHIKFHGISTKLQESIDSSFGEVYNTATHQPEFMSSNGYKYIYAPDNPHCNNNGYVPEHRFIMERVMGRYLLTNEVVHHKNHNRLDNRIENLEVMSKSDHSRLHMKKTMTRVHNK